MTQEDYDIQMQVDNLMHKVLESWKREGKWDGNNPNSPFYGFEKDPLLRILLTAFENGMVRSTDSACFPSIIPGLSISNLNVFRSEG